MPRHFARHPTGITPEVAERRTFLYFIEAKLGLDEETAEELANSDEELKDILESARIVAKRASVQFGGATHES